VTMNDWQIMRLAPGVAAVAAYGPPCPVDGNVVGVGLGALAAAAAAAQSGLDMVLIRRRPKAYGAGRQIDGTMHSSRPNVVYATSDEEVEIARAVGLRVDHEVRVHVTDICGPFNLSRPSGLLPPPRQLVPDLQKRTRLLRGDQFVRSSGEVVDHYIETLEAAFNFDVASTFARRHVASAPYFAGVAWGGVYLAAVAAQRFCSHLLAVDPSRAFATSAQPRLDGAVVLVDDLINTGSCARQATERLEGLGLQVGGIINLYGFAGADHPGVEVVAWIDRPKARDRDDGASEVGVVQVPGKPRRW
jgi:orotate phosphoribosyltransferase